MSARTPKQIPSLSPIIVRKNPSSHSHSHNQHLLNTDTPMTLSPRSSEPSDWADRSDMQSLEADSFVYIPTDSNTGGNYHDLIESSSHESKEAKDPSDGVSNDIMKDSSEEKKQPQSSSSFPSNSVQLHSESTTSVPPVHTSSSILSRLRSATSWVYESVSPVISSPYFPLTVFVLGLCIGTHVGVKHSQISHEIANDTARMQMERLKENEKRAIAALFQELNDHQSILIHLARFHTL